MVGRSTVDWGKVINVALWTTSATSLSYVSTMYVLGPRSLHLLIVAAWGLLMALGALAWTVARSVAFATDRILTMLDRPEDPPLRSVGRRRGQG